MFGETHWVPYRLTESIASLQGWKPTHTDVSCDLQVWLEGECLRRNLHAA